jgi:trk system potassium uptake protein TrkA
MNILILGAGQVGSAIATQLAVDEENYITLVDSNQATLDLASKYLDINTILGPASYPSVLERAGIASADMLIAVTQSDETNMLACQMAHTLYKVGKKIARIRTTEYLYNPELFDEKAIPIDFIITPENIITNYITRVIEEPGAAQIFEFEDGLIQLVESRVFANSPIVGLPIIYLHQHLPHTKLRVVSIYRDGKALKVSGKTIIKNGDRVFFLTDKNSVKQVLREFRRLDRPYNNIIIAGGGRIGFRLAKFLENSHNVRIIEQDKERAKYLASELDNTLVLTGSASDERLLIDEDIEKTDLFIALTDSDEINVIVAILAKKLGAHKTIALVKRNIYEDLALKAGEIDMVLSPDQVTSGEILSHIRKGNTMTVHSMIQNESEAIEIILESKAKGVVDKKIKDIVMPEGVEIGSVVRGGELIMPTNELILKTGDHILIIITDMSQVHTAEELFTGDS